MQPYSSSGQNPQSSIYEAAADEILTEGLQIRVETAGDKGRRVGRPVTYQDKQAFVSGLISTNTNRSSVLRTDLHLSLWN